MIIFRWFNTNWPLDIQYGMFALRNLNINPNPTLSSSVPWREHRKGSHFGRVHLTSTGDPRLGLGSPKDVSCYFKNTWEKNKPVSSLLLKLIGSHCQSTLSSLSKKCLYCWRLAKCKHHLKRFVSCPKVTLDYFNFVQYVYIYQYVFDMLFRTKTWNITYRYPLTATLIGFQRWTSSAYPIASNTRRDNLCTLKTLNFVL